MEDNTAFNIHAITFSAHSCQQKEENSYASGVKLRSEMENTASLGFSSFAIIDFPLSQRIFVLFKNILLSREVTKSPRFSCVCLLVWNGGVMGKKWMNLM